MTKKFSLILGCLFLNTLYLGCTSINSDPGQNPSTSNETIEKLDPLPEDAIDGVLTKVGSEIVMLSDLNNALEAATQGKESISPTGRLQNHAIPKEQVEAIYSSLVDQRIMEIKAKELGLSVDEDELTSRIQEFLTSQNYTEEELEKQLIASHKTMKEYRETFRKEVLKQLVVGRLISPFVNVTNDEVTRFYLKETKDNTQIKAVKLRSLLINIPENYYNNPKNYPLVLKISSAIAQKEDFETLTKNFSQATDVGQTAGLLPPKPIKNLPKELQDNLTNLENGQIVGPVEVGHIVFFFQYLGSELLPTSNLTANFEQWKNKLLNIKFSERLAEYLERERSAIRIVERPFEIK